MRLFFPPASPQTIGRWQWRARRARSPDGVRLPRFALLLPPPQDLLNAQTAAEVMEFLEVTGIKDRWIHVEGCSAKTGEGREGGIEKMIKNINKE